MRRCLLVLILSLAASCVVMREISLPVGSPAGESSAGEAGEIEAEVHELINRHRTGQGLPPLVYNPALAEIARGHSRNMAEGRVPFGHAGFDERAQAIRRIVAFRSISENVASNNSSRSVTARVAVQGWLESSGHRRNIEGQYSLTGVGIVRDPQGTFYFTQIFVQQ